MFFFFSYKILFQPIPLPYSALTNSFTEDQKQGSMVTVTLPLSQHAKLCLCFFNVLG